MGAKLFSPSGLPKPKATFSATVKVSTSMKCWWIMPMPVWIATAGESMFTGEPSKVIDPSSGW